MKTYVITLSKHFMKGHPKAGEKTYFENAFLLGQKCPQCGIIQDLSGENISQCNSCVRAISHPKIHTIRNNYDLWKKRIDEVQKGNAILSIRQWSDKPYRSKQEVIFKLSAKDGVGIQELDCDKPFALEIEGKPLNYQHDMVNLANNDGLFYADWNKWFDIEKASGKKAIIHFTSFRY